MENNKIYSAIDIANKIISSCDASKGELISNLKLQKMLYYMQGFFIAVFDRRLFEEPIVAWQYGPVVEEAYHFFKSFNDEAIHIKDNETIIDLPAREDFLFNNVMEEYGQYSAIKLMNMTHEETPWKTVFDTNPRGEITYELLRDYFKTQIEY